MDRPDLRSLAPADDRRARWTLVAAGCFAVAGLLAALVGAAVVAGLGTIYGARGPVGPVSPGLATVVALWFAGPTVGAAVAAIPAWGVSVELLGRRIVAADPDRSWLAYPLLGGVAGALGGIGLHVVTWEVVTVGLAIADGPIGPALAGELAVAVGLGVYLGALSVGVGGIVTVPAVGVAGIALGWGRHAVATADRPETPDEDRDRGRTGETEARRPGDGTGSGDR